MKQKKKNNKKILLISLGILVLLLILIILAINFNWFTTTGDAVSNTASGKVIVNVVRP
jgi:flagellar basal body-associated protein FliL